MAVLAVSFLMLAGCSSTQTKVDRGPIHARTFSFLKPGPKAVGAYDTKPVTAAHAAVQEAITRNLAARGVTKVPNDGDVTVAYLLIIGNNASTTSINDYFGYGDDAAKLHDKAQEAYAGADSRGYFSAGTLVIDIIDPNGYLLKRGYATRGLLDNPTPEAQAKHIQEAVDEILRDARIEN